MGIRSWLHSKRRRGSGLPEHFPKLIDYFRLSSSSLTEKRSAELDLGSLVLVLEPQHCRLETVVSKSKGSAVNGYSPREDRRFFQVELPEHKRSLMARLFGSSKIEPLVPLDYLELRDGTLTPASPEDLGQPLILVEVDGALELVELVEASVRELTVQRADGSLDRLGIGHSYRDPAALYSFLSPQEVDVP